jgi:hypothetical protein
MLEASTQPKYKIARKKSKPRRKVDQQVVIVLETLQDNQSDFARTGAIGFIP